MCEKVIPYVISCVIFHVLSNLLLIYICKLHLNLSCVKSDDLVMSAALHVNGIRRYRITLNDDCREGLQQYEFGFKKDALQIEGGGHHKKYYTCLRAISAFYLTEKQPLRVQPTCPVIETVFSSSLAMAQITPRNNWTLQTLGTENWPVIDYSLCSRLQAASTGDKKRDDSGLAIRWSKDWRLKPSKNSYFLKCWYESILPPDSLWRCSFPPTMPEQTPISLSSDSGFRMIPLQLGFPDDRVFGHILPSKRAHKAKVFEETNPLIRFTKNTYVGKLIDYLQHSNRRLQKSGGKSFGNSNHSNTMVSKKLGIATVDLPTAGSKRVRQKGNNNVPGGWDRIYAYAELLRGYIPLRGPLTDDKKDISITHDRNGSDETQFQKNQYNASSLLHNDASNYYAVPHNTMSRFPKYFLADVQQRLLAVQRSLGGGDSFGTSVDLLDLLQSSKKGVRPSALEKVSSQHGLDKVNFFLFAYVFSIS